MIPYDDLVVALSSWRARQGLPVVQTAGAVPAPLRPPTTPAARAAPPHAPPRATGPAAVPAIAPELQDFDGEALIEESPYDANGDDYVVQLAAVQIDPLGESTAVGDASEVVTEGLLIPKRGKRNPDW
jgi:hypothetical protein